MSGYVMILLGSVLIVLCLVYIILGLLRQNTELGAVNEELEGQLERADQSYDDLLINGGRIGRRRRSED